MVLIWARQAKAATFLTLSTLARNYSCLGFSTIISGSRHYLLKHTTTTAPSSSSVILRRQMSSRSSTSLPLSPPNPRRDEYQYVLAGKLRPGDVGYADPKHPDKPLLRQSESSTEPLLDPPVKIPDPYGWMRDESRSNPEMLDHLKQENEYTEQLTTHQGDLRTELYEEMLAGIKETDHTVPSPEGDYLYYSRTFEGKSYRSYCRAPKNSSDDDSWIEQAKSWDGTTASPILPGEQVYLDVNELAKDQTYCSTGGVSVSPSSTQLAYTVDFTGNEVSGLYITDIATGEIIDHDETLECGKNVKWGSDDTTVFYLKMDEQKRPYQLYRRTLGGSSPEEKKEDELLYEELNELYWVGMSKSFDEKYLFVSSQSKETSEVHFLDLENDSAELQCVAKRRPKVLYSVRHRCGYWYITTNVGGTPNMRLMVSPSMANSEEQWVDVVNSNDGTTLFDGGYERTISGLTSFGTQYAVATGREGGLPQIWVITYQDDDDKTKVTDFLQLSFEEDAYDVGLGANYDSQADSVIIAYNSLVTPISSIRIPLADLSRRTVLKEQVVPGYDKSQYACERTTVKSRDSTGSVDIPVSIVYRKDVMERVELSGETVPAHLYGYGSYGACMEASFRNTRRTLLDRGMVYVIAHVRGGGEMGRNWYEAPHGAKYLCKKNTFNDFIDVANWLIKDRNITSPNQLSCEGRSAGGLLIGAAINQAPELFRMALLGVPFVDVVCTMVDASIPLTIVEWEEWGNPNEEKYFQYMMEYSPTNNIKKNASGNYPACLLTGGLHDPRVQYWEPAKYAAELRYQTQAQADNNNSRPTCVKIDMTAGHFSASDRYKYLKELAFDYAFLLDQLGLYDSKAK